MKIDKDAWLRQDNFRYTLMMKTEAPKYLALTQALNAKNEESERLGRLVDSLSLLAMRHHEEIKFFEHMVGNGKRRRRRPPCRKRHLEVRMPSEAEQLRAVSLGGLAGLPEASELRSRVARHFHALARLPRPDSVPPRSAEWARDAVQLFLDGKISQLKRCGRSPICEKYFFGPKGKVYCSDSCRASENKAIQQALNPEREKQTRRRQYLATKGIPDCEERIKRLEIQPLANANRISKWKARLRSYRDELRRLEGKRESL